MANDHYVPVTYLQRFLDPKRQNLLHVYYKHDQGYRCQKPRKVCRERDGDDNPYYRDPRILKSLLGVFEPKWGSALDSFIADPGDPDSRFMLAGMTAYLMSWVPAVRRIFTDGIELQMEAMRPMLAKQARYDIDDLEEAEKTAEALLDKRILVKVDPHFPRAMALRNMLSVAARLFEGNWMLAKVPDGKHFITSDNPAVKLHLSESDMFGKVFLPLDPKHAIIVLTKSREEGEEPDLARLTPGDIEVGEMDKKAFQDLTELMVKSAERVVISSQEDGAVHQLVKDYGDWGMIAQQDKIPTGNGMYLITRMRPGQLPRSG